MANRVGAPIRVPWIRASGPGARFFNFDQVWPEGLAHNFAHIDEYLAENPLQHLSNKQKICSWRSRR